MLSVPFIVRFITATSDTVFLKLYTVFLKLPYPHKFHIYPLQSFREDLNNGSQNKC